MCAWKAFISLADVPFRDIILCRGISDTASCCDRGEVWVPAVWRIHACRQLVLRVAPNMLFIICRCAVPKMTVKTGPAKTRPAGPLAAAMLDHH